MTSADTPCSIMELTTCACSVGVFIRVGDDRRIAVLGKRHLRRSGELGEERIAQIVDDKADQADIGGAQICGGAVIDIADAAIVSRTSSRVSSFTSGLSCSTRLTVDFDTPAAFATSMMVGRGFIHEMPCSARSVRIRSICQIRFGQQAAPDRQGGTLQHNA